MPHDDVNKIPFPAGTTVVRIGEVKTAGRDVILRATLGSCVGIGVLWRSRGLYALAHCLLPDAPPGEVSDAGQGARYLPGPFRRCCACSMHLNTHTPNSTS
ncbi:hypothetical protein [Caballeronia sp.]|uniref:hypothetical protein n=1 Tax=Caballeronia sp. TaxID=1931223 RepID=UPI003C5A7F26